MTNEQEPNSVADKEIFELAEILLALQSRLPVTKVVQTVDSIDTKRTPTPATSPSVTERQVMVESPPSSPEGLSKKENHAPVTPVVNHKRPAPETTSSPSSSKKDPVEQERKKRKRVTEEQLTVLETIFATDKMPDQKLRLQLAQRLGMSSRRVQIWFQNKRAKLKKANANSPNSSPTMGHSIGKLGAAGSQALYSARFSLPSANSASSARAAAASNNNNTNNTNNASNATKSATPAPSSCNNSSSNINAPTPNLVAPFNFPSLSFHSFASHGNFMGAYSNSSMPGGSYSLPISRPVK